MNIQEEILNAIDVMVQKGIEKSNPETTRRGVVTGIKDGKYQVSIDGGIKDGKYQVSIDGTEVNVYDSVGCNPKIGDGVFVQTPNGSLINAFITGLLKSNAKGGGGGTDVVANPEGQATDDLEKIQISGVIYEVVGGSVGDQKIVSVNSMPAQRVPSYVYLIRGDMAVI